MAGRKVFAPATVLTAGDVNDFLMDQSVMVFANSAARDTAIPAPTEGMLTYLEDSGDFEYRDSVGAWVGLVEVTSVSGSAITGDITNATISAQNVTPAIQTLGAATYTVADTDAQNTLVFTAATATVTFSTATAFSAGDRVDIIRDSANVLTIEAGAGVVFAGKDALGTAISFIVDEKYEASSVLCVGTDEYRVIGAVTAI